MGTLDLDRRADALHSHFVASFEMGAECGVIGAVEVSTVNGVISLSGPLAPRASISMATRGKWAFGSMCQRSRRRLQTDYDSDHGVSHRRAAEGADLAAALVAGLPAFWGG